MTSSPARRQGLNHVVHRTMAALEILAGAPDGVTVQQTAHALAVDKSVASRLLASLHEIGYVVRDPATERYELSLRIVSLASQQVDRLGFPGICQPLLEELANATGELVQLSVVQQEDLVIAGHAQAYQRLTIRPSVGANVTPHATASGKVFLASLPNQRAVEIALRRGLPALTDLTITKVDDLLAEWDRVRADGYAVARGEFIEGVSAIAFEIGRDRFGKVVGTVALSAPSGRLGPDRFEELVDEVRATAAQIELVWPASAVRIAAAIDGREPLQATPTALSIVRGQ